MTIQDSKNVDGIPTILEFLLDETQSMGSYIQQTINGFNNFIDNQKEVDGECFVTLTKFDTDGFRTPYTDLDINCVPHLNTSTFIPNEGTNFRDAIIHRMNIRKTLLETWDIKPKILFVVLTDGEDNSSNLSVSYVKEQITSTFQNDDWAFIYLGAYPNSSKVGIELGFPENNIKCFSGKRMKEEFNDLSSATTAYRSGMTNSSNIYETV